MWYAYCNPAICFSYHIKTTWMIRTLISLTNLIFGQLIVLNTQQSHQADPLFLQSLTTLSLTRGPVILKGFTCDCLVMLKPCAPAISSYRHNSESLREVISITLLIMITINTGLILGLCPANERRRYFVTTSLIGWAQTWFQVTLWASLNSLWPRGIIWQQRSGSTLAHVSLLPDGIPSH